MKASPSMCNLLSDLYGFDSVELMLAQGKTLAYIVDALSGDDRPTMPPPQAHSPAMTIENRGSASPVP